MKIFQGCVRGDEIARVKKGANPHTVDLVRKTKTQEDPAPAPTEPPENADMDAAELAKAQASAVTIILSMDDVAKAHYLGLDADGQVAFLAKSADERKVDVEASKKAAETKKATEEAEAAKAAGKTVRELELEKRLDGQAVEIEALKSAKVEDDLAKRARDEFDGYPGGVIEVVPLLKAYAKLPEAERTASEKVLKAQAELAKRSGTHIGLMSEDELTKGAPAHAELQKKAMDLAAKEGIDVEVAKGKILTNPKESDLYNRVAAEENSQRAQLN